MSSAHMDLTAVDASMRGLAANAEQYQQAWAKDEAELDAFLPALGSGVLGQAFQPGYERASASIRPAVAVVPRRYRRYAEAGTKSVADYREADLRSARGFHPS